MKQKAEMDRPHSVKGQKDRTDILNLLINDHVDLEKYMQILSQHHLQKYKDRLLDIVREAEKEFSYLGIQNLRKRKLIKNEIIHKLQELQNLPRNS